MVSSAKIARRCALVPSTRGASIRVISGQQDDAHGASYAKQKEKVDIPQIELRAYQHIVVVTGAGVSAASGLHTYRGAGGLWNDPEIEKYAHVETLKRNPRAVWQHFGQIRQVAARAQPNPAHLSLAGVEADLAPNQSFLLITQNIDGLHDRAGSRKLVEFHGAIRRSRCMDPHCKLKPFEDAETHLDALPACPQCGQPLRPDIVLFGEYIPSDALYRSQQALQNCDLFIAAGTSGMVYPAASFVDIAHAHGARTILANLEPMEAPNDAFQEEYLGRAEEVLPRLLGY
jgi:NAD-dependent deacetylase